MGGMSMTVHVRRTMTATRQFGRAARSLAVHHRTSIQPQLGGALGYQAAVTVSSAPTACPCSAQGHRRLCDLPPAAAEKEGTTGQLVCASDAVAVTMAVSARALPCFWSPMAARPCCAARPSHPLGSCRSDRRLARAPVGTCHRLWGCRNVRRAKGQRASSGSKRRTRQTRRNCVHNSHGCRHSGQRCHWSR